MLARRGRNGHGLAYGLPQLWPAFARRAWPEGQHDHYRIFSLLPALPQAVAGFCRSGRVVACLAAAGLFAGAGKFECCKRVPRVGSPGGACARAR